MQGSPRILVNAQQYQMSKQIYNDKHNAATQRYGNNKVDARRENQQDRIANGMASEQTKRGSGVEVEKNEAAINQEVHTDGALREEAGQPAAESDEPEHL